MDKVANYLDMLPWPLLLGSVVFAALAFAMTPSRYRLGVCLALAVIWLTLGALPRLGTAAALAKATSVLPFTLIAVAAWLHPGARRKLPAIILIYPVMAAIAPIYVLTTIDAGTALALRLNWFMLTCAALLTVRTIVSNDDLMYVVRWLTYGLGAAVLLPASAVILEPAEAMRGHFRLFAWGANPEGMGTLFILTAGFASYYALRGKSSAKPIALLIAGIGTALAIMTASRGTIFGTALVLMPVLFAWAKRPAYALIGLTLVLIPTLWLVGQAERINLERLSTLQSGRFDLYIPYLEVIATRPFFGLFMTEHQSFFQLADGFPHPHNAYIQMLYLGGLSYAIPMMFIVFWVCCSAIYCWINRTYLSNDPLLTKFFVVLMLTMFAHGMVNDVVFYPTFAWPLFHVIVATLLVSAAADIRAVKTRTSTLGTITPGMRLA